MRQWERELMADTCRHRVRSVGCEESRTDECGG